MCSKMCCVLCVYFPFPFTCVFPSCLACYPRYFRSSLDHWSTFLGMIFALNYPAAKHWMSVVESLPPARCVAVKAAAAVPVIGLLWWW